MHVFLGVYVDVLVCLGHSHIDILKIDIEGYEFESLAAFIKPYISGSTATPIPVGQLQLEIHIWKQPFATFLSWWESLEAVGLRPFWTEVCISPLFHHH